jgi:hypothetical protein
MDLVYNLFLILHLLGMAALVGGWLVFTRGADAVEVMVWGARAQILTGLVLAGLGRRSTLSTRARTTPRSGSSW